MIDFHIEVFDSLPSTQDVCKDHAFKGASEGLVVQAREQTQGRGRHGRAWVGSKGNLACSILLRPECEARRVGQISILIGVALGEAIRLCSDKSVILKWPNDVVLNDAKCAGILLESELSTKGQIKWVVAGIGVNIIDAPDDKEYLGDSINCDYFLKLFLKSLALHYSQWKSDGFDDIRKKWMDMTYFRGSILNVGVFDDLDTYGNLIVLDDQNAKKIISAGDVYLKDRNYAIGH